MNTHNLTDDFYLKNIKRLYCEMTGDRVEAEERRKAERARDTKKQLAENRFLTAFLNFEGIRDRFFRWRTLCSEILGDNLAKGLILHTIVNRFLVTDEEKLYLSYKYGTGYCFWHSAKDFYRETRVSERTIYRLIPELKAEGWIDYHLKQDDFGRKVYHVKLNIQVFVARAAAYMQYHLPNLAKRILPKEEDLSYINKQKKEHIEPPLANAKQRTEEQPNQEAAENYSPTTAEKPKVANEPKQQADSFCFGNQADTDRATSQTTNEKSNVSSVEEKVNSTDKPILKKDRKVARHNPEGDRHFNNRHQQGEIRDKAQQDSAIGVSGFKDAEDLRECQRQLSVYFLQKMPGDKAAEKAGWIIRGEVKGERSPFVEDYLKGLPIGSWCMQAWEIQPGVIAPIFLAYLRHKLRKGEDTNEQVISKVNWFIRDGDGVSDSWAECKRLLAIEKPKFLKAVELGLNLDTLDIPDWVRDTFRPETSVQEAAEAAEMLGTIAIQQQKIIAAHQEQLYKPQNLEIPKLPSDSPYRKLLNKFGILDSTAQIDEGREGRQMAEEQEKNNRVDELMDKVAEASDLLDAVPAAEEEQKPESGSPEEINVLLSDPITRARGVAIAKQKDLPLLLDDNGVAIAIEVQVEESDSKKAGSRGDEGHGVAHEIYTPPAIEKGSKSAWADAIANSSFLQRMRSQKES